MRTIITILFLILGSYLAASEITVKKLPLTACEEIYGAIEGLLAHADNKWEELKKQPGISVSEEISWVMNLADNYSTVYQTFCK